MCKWSFFSSELFLEDVQHLSIMKNMIGYDEVLIKEDRIIDKNKSLINDVKIIRSKVTKIMISY